MVWDIKNIVKVEIMSEQFDYDTVKQWLEARVHTTIKQTNKDFAVMQTMLSNHPNYKDWKNQECEAFKITRSARNKALQVHMKMKTPNASSAPAQTNAQPMGSKFGDMKTLKKKSDGWRIVSWVSCATGKVVRKPNDTNKLTQAMRFAVRKQIQNWRNALGNRHNPKCVLCDCSVYAELEVDHFPNTFASMKDDFIANVLGGNIEDVKIRWDNRKTSYRFGKGETINAKWQRYHAGFADYRWLCKNCNKKMNGKTFADAHASLA